MGFSKSVNPIKPYADAHIYEMVHSFHRILKKVKETHSKEYPVAWTPDCGVDAMVFYLCIHMYSLKGWVQGDRRKLLFSSPKQTFVCPDCGPGAELDLKNQYLFPYRHMEEGFLHLLFPEVGL